MADEPIVLIHGLFGFNELKPVGAKGLAYFRDIAQTLGGAGYRVADPPQLSPAGTVAGRAAQLKEYLDSREETRLGKLHLLAHSMGGLDARHMISVLGMSGRVATLTTLGTPHEGSLVADWIKLVAGPFDPMLASLAGMFGVGQDNIGGIADLTTGARMDYNARVSDDPAVRYYSVAGCYVPERALGYPLGPLGWSRDLIQGQRGDNDGLVSVDSARFQSRAAQWHHLGTWDANHFRLINWPSGLAGPEAEWQDRAIAEKYLDVVGTVIRY